GVAPNCRLIASQVYEGGTEQASASELIWLCGFDPTKFFKSGDIGLAFLSPPALNSSPHIISLSYKLPIENEDVIKVLTDITSCFGRSGRGCLILNATGNLKTPVDVAANDPSQNIIIP